MFGYPPQLFTDQGNTFKTQLSGLISLILLLTLLNVFQSNIFQYLDMQQITSSVSQSQLSNPAEIIMTGDNFMFAVSLQQTDYIFNERPYFNVTLKQKVLGMDENGKRVKNFTQIMMEPCKLHKFQNIFSRYGQDFSDQYLEINLDQWLCPVDNYQMLLGGSFSNSLFEFVKIEITQCQNSTTTIDSWNPSCAPNESVSNAKQHALSIYTTNYIVNSQDPNSKTFITPYLNDQLYFNFYPEKLFKSVDIFYREQEIITDQSIFYGSNLESDIIFYNDYQDYNERVDVQQGQVYSAFYFRRSMFKETAQRQFDKFADLLSYLGGFTGILIPLCTAFLQSYNKLAFILYIANKIYFYNIKNESHYGVSQSTGSIKQKDFISDSKQLKKNKDLTIGQEQTSIYKKNNKKDLISEDLFVSNIKMKESQVVHPMNIYYNSEQTPQKIDESFIINENVGLVNIIQSSSKILPLQIQTLQHDNYQISNENTRSFRPKFSLFQQESNLNDKETLDFFKVDAEDRKNNLKIQQKSVQKKLDPLKLIKFDEFNISPPMKTERSRAQQLFKKIKIKLFFVAALIQINKKKSHIFEQSQTQTSQKLKTTNCSFKWIINQLTFGRCFNNQQTKITNEIINQIYTDLDVVKLIQNDQELKKLKQIILQEKQLILFNILPKKVINMDELRTIKFKDLKQLAQKRINIEDQLEPDFQQMKIAYGWCVAGCEESNEYQSNLNNKLIESLGIKIRKTLAR